MEILKSQCNLTILWGSTYVCRKKRLAERSFFSELEFTAAGSRACNPWWEFEGIAVELFVYVVLRLNGVKIVLLNYHIKASVTLITFVRKNQIIPW